MSAASEELGLPSGDGARAAFLTLLAKETFVPPPRALAAAVKLGAIDVPLAAEANDEHRELEQTDLADFVNHYWSLSRDDRLAQWEALAKNCTDPSSQSELKRLAAGLEIDAQPTGNAMADHLGKLVRELYLQPPRARAVRRSEWLRDHAGEEEWRDAARMLADQKHLEPRLFEFLERPHAVAAVPSISDDERERVEIIEARKAQQRFAPEKRYERPAPAKETFWSSWMGVVIAMVIIGGLKMCFRVNDRPSPAPTNIKSFDHGIYEKQLQQENARKLQEAIKNINETSHKPPKIAFFTESMIRQYEAYDPASGKPKPEGYDDWIRDRSNGSSPATKP